MSQIRRYELRRGDMVKGQVRPPKETEKYAALQRARRHQRHATPRPSQGRPKFADLTPVYPDERLRMEHGPEFMTARIIDLVAPIGKGQRGLIVSPPKAGKTTVLKDIAASITANNPEVYLMCLLVDERPEEVTDMERSIHGEVVSSTFDMPSEQPHRRGRARHGAREAPRRERLRRRDPARLDHATRARLQPRARRRPAASCPAASTRTALYPPKKFFGAARNIEFGGSLTILATALVDTGSKMDEVIFEEFKGTGNMELRLDRGLADRRIFPAIDVITSGTRKEELLLDPQEAPFVWGVRRILHGIDNPERAMDMLIKGLKQTT